MQIHLGLFVATGVLLDGIALVQRDPTILVWMVPMLFGCLVWEAVLALSRPGRQEPIEHKLPQPKAEPSSWQSRLTAPLSTEWWGAYWLMVWGIVPVALTVVLWPTVGLEGWPMWTVLASVVSLIAIVAIIVMFKWLRSGLRLFLRLAPR